MACRQSLIRKPLQVAVLILVAHLSVCATQTPADHLVPPSPPTLTPGDLDNRDSGLMTRIARWFGLAGEEQQPQLSSNSYLNNEYAAASSVKNAYHYNKPPQADRPQQQPCNLCNKYPWVPMLPPAVHYNLPQNQAPNAWTQPIHTVPQRQRAIKFNLPPAFTAPPPNSYGGAFVPSNGPKTEYTPIPIPQLSGNAMPPLYKAQLFRPIAPTNNVANFQSQQHIQQQPPQTGFGHFAENVGAHSEIQTDRVVPHRSNVQIKTEPNNNANFEIVKSHQLTEFVSSVEYPPTFVQSIDLPVAQNRPPMPANHKESENPVSTVNFKHEQFNSPVLNSHIPASHIITELGNFDTVQSTPPPELTDLTTVDYNNSYYTDSASGNPYQIGHNYADNLPAASTHNANESLEYGLNTQGPVNAAAVTEKSESTDVEFSPSVQTNLIHRTEKPIDYPFHVANAPRPFTRDPNAGHRVNSKQTQNHENYVGPVYLQNSNSPQRDTQPWYAQHPASAVPTPTSNYTSVDASGQYAGMSPPNEPSTPLIIPSLPTKVQPRPFEPSRAASSITNHFVSFDKWAQNKGPNGEHEKANTPTRPPTPRYVTKILASNLRELLQREHDSKNKTKMNAFDIAKLQKNIDDWTEQEYTSLSHRPSTPTIRGRSKNIPNEYLTTPSPTPRNHKATKSLSLNAKELSTSINNLEPILFNRGNAKQLRYKSIERNHIDDEPQFMTTTRAPSTNSYVTSTTTSFDETTETTTQYTPYYLRAASFQEPTELWKKVKVDISPKTMEKVYVVTPQPTFFPQRHVPADTAASTTADNGVERGFKTPRFLVRPTPGHGALNAPPTHSQHPAPTKSHYQPVENFGLKGLSAFVPAQPVEIIDGNSKVVTIASPSNMLRLPKVAERKSDVPAQTKSSMQPSPR